MILTVASYKGGVGKTTTAVHLAAYFQTLGPTLLLDSDKTRNATGWMQRAKLDPSGKSGFPFEVASIDHAAKLAHKFAYVVIDTGQRPSIDELQSAADACDLLVIPAVPSALDSDGLVQTVRALQNMHATNFRVLLTRVAPDAANEAAELRELLDYIEVPAFTAQIPRLKAFEKAAGAGQTVDQVSHDPNAQRAWQSYVDAGKEIA